MEIHTLLLVGNEYRFLAQAKDFEQYLKGEVGINPNNIRLLPCAYHSATEIVDHVRTFFERSITQNARLAVFSYYGHGGKGEFFPNGSESISYSNLVKVFPSNLDFIFINDSCYSGSIIEPFKKRGLIPKNGLVLTSSSAEEESSNTMNVRLLQTWRSRKKFLKKKNGRIITGKIIVRFDNNRITMRDDGDVITDRLGQYIETEFLFKEPRITSIGGSTFQRCGKSLDYLLFPTS